MCSATGLLIKPPGPPFPIPHPAWYQNCLAGQASPLARGKAMTQLGPAVPQPVGVAGASPSSCCAADPCWPYSHAPEGLPSCPAIRSWGLNTSQDRSSSPPGSSLLQAERFGLRQVVCDELTSEHWLIPSVYTFSSSSSLLILSTSQHIAVCPANPSPLARSWCLCRLHYILIDESPEV